MLSWGEVLLVMFRLLRLPTFMCVSVCLGEVCYREVTNLIKRKEALCF